MRFAAIVSLIAVALAFTACDDEEEATLLAAQVGAIDAETEIVFEDTVYRPTAAVAREDVEEGELEQVGVTDEFSKPYEGAIPVYEREGEDDAVYTPAITIDPPGSVDDFWIRWLPAERFNLEQ